jgi:outer membrane protein
MTMRRFIAVVCVSLLGAPLIAQDERPRLTLEEAIQLALDHNKTLKVDGFFRTIARANLLEAQGRFDPSVNFRRSYSEDEDPKRANPLVREVSQRDDYSLSLDGLTPWGLSYSLGTSARNSRGTFNAFADDYGTFGGVTITQPLLRGFGFGGNLFSVRVAKANRAISDLSFRQSVIDTVTDVVVAYSNLVFANENLRISRRARELGNTTVENNAKRFQAGSMSEADVVQARAQVAQRGEAIIFAERALRDADNTLRLLIGEASFSLNGPLLPVETPALPPVTVNLPDDLKAAYEVRPDYLSARQGLKRERASEQFARNQLLPRVDFVGSYGYSGADREFAASRRMVADEDHRSYSAGVVVSVPLTFAEGRGRLRAARTEMRQAEADLERLAQDIALSVTSAAGQIETTRQRVLATRNAFDLASQALAGEQKKLQVGSTTTFVVLNLQSSLTSIETTMARSLADQRRAAALYERELGTILQRYNIALKP